MPPLDPLKTIEYLRRIVTAIAEGRIEARQVAEMTDEQIVDYSTRLGDEWEAAINEGKELAGQ
jgi:hypothetical protein